MSSNLTHARKVADVIAHNRYTTDATNAQRIEACKSLEGHVLGGLLKEKASYEQLLEKLKKQRKRATEDDFCDIASASANIAYLESAHELIKAEMKRLEGEGK